mgnify:CR=1 FL=1
MLSLRAATLNSDQVLELNRRLELMPQLLRRQIEEQISTLVPLPEEWLSEQREAFLGAATLEDGLSAHGWLEADLDLHLRRPEALKRFAEQRFGPGLEEQFLTHGAQRDTIIYSLIRVRDRALAQELWIRLEEQEMTFAEAALSFGEGPEADRKGVIGPLPIGQLQPQVLADSLRRLQPGELHPPFQLGEWQVLMRLEKLTPASFDAHTREQMLQEQLNSFLNARVEQLLAGETPDPLHYDAPQ